MNMNLEKALDEGGDLVSFYLQSKHILMVTVIFKTLQLLPRFWMNVMLTLYLNIRLFPGPSASAMSNASLKIVEGQLTYRKRIWRN